MPHRTGTVLENRYRIENLLGHGGMGAVYRAWDLRLNLWVALKENSLTSPEAQTQFSREAQVLARLRHPNLPRVIDHFITNEGLQYLVMDFIDGANLAEMLKLHGRQSTADVEAWFGQVCDALTYLHGQNPPVIHRDIKPQNIKITRDGRAVLVDFGLSKVGTQQHTATGALGVTPGFSPLEQYGGAGGTDERSDVYALAATLYAALTGETPPDSVQRAVSSAPVKLPRQLNPMLSPALEEALMHGLQTQREQRPPSVRSLQQEVQSALSAPPNMPAAPSAAPAAAARSAVPASQPRPAAPARSGLPVSGWALVAVGGLVVVLLAVAGLTLVSGRNGSSATDTPAVIAGPLDSGTPATAIVIVATATPTPLPPPALETPAGQQTAVVVIVTVEVTVPPAPTAAATTPPPAPTVAATATPTSGPQVIVNSNALNVRSGPSTDYTVSGSVARDERLSIIGRNEARTWWQICCTSGGVAGWVIGSLVNIEGDTQAVPVVAVAPPPPTATPRIVATATPVAQPTPTTQQLLPAPTILEPAAGSGVSLRPVYDDNGDEVERVGVITVRWSWPYELGPQDWFAAQGYGSSTQFTKDFSTALNISDRSRGGGITVFVTHYDGDPRAGGVERYRVSRQANVAINLN